MREFFLKLLLVFIYFINIDASSGQNNSIKYKSFKPDDFEKNKVYDQTYHLWWYKNRWFPNSKDTLPYFVDDRNYKGIINYGVEFRSKDFRIFNFTENLSMCFLRINITKCRYNLNDSVIDIEGVVSGGWDKLERRENIQNNIDIFLGEKKDSVNYCYLGKNVNKEAIEIKKDNKTIDEFTVLDTFPSFHFKNYSYLKTVPEGNRPFKIKGKITQNTLLAFGSRSCYSEIFDIGSMIFNPNKNKTKKGIIRHENDCIALIIKNKLIKDIEKEKLPENITNYYSYTEKAENFIIKSQFNKAKEQYNLLNQNYSTIFTRDIHNAIRCCILSRDYQTAFLWGEKLASKGINKNYFDSKTFTNIKKSVLWQKFINKYDSIVLVHKGKLNFNLKKQIEDLVEEDQRDYGLNSRKDSKTLYETTERVTEKLICLLKKEGFPSEEKIGVYIKKDTTLVAFPSYNVLIRHAIQQKPKNLSTLLELLDKSITALEYDSKRSPNNVMETNTCLHIYKGNLYNSKSCGANELMIKKIIFKFNNPKGFIIDNTNYIITEYDKENPEEYEKYYSEQFNFIKKLTDDWEFYEK